MSSVTLAATAAVASAPIATTTTASAAAAAAGTGRAFFTRPRDVDGQRPALKFLAVEHFDGLVRFLRTREFDEGKAARFTGEFIEHEVHRSDHTGLGEILLQVIFHRLVREITDEESGFIHNSLPLKKPSGEILQPAGSLNVKLLH